MPWTIDTRKVVVVGAGIAGLCAAVYARKCGYEVEVLEQRGGAATTRSRPAFNGCSARIQAGRCIRSGRRCSTAAS
ncbi:FAD-dependent oxidoreductase [Ectothiorhodospiraceae bacterium 2226]|nr:FAD-dependent oxidoreductase [Ectothiorhodospiraceae bacterium 2226]